MSAQVLTESTDFTTNVGLSPLALLFSFPYAISWMQVNVGTISNCGRPLPIVSTAWPIAAIIDEKIFHNARWS